MISDPLGIARHDKQACIPQAGMRRQARDERKHTRHHLARCHINLAAHRAHGEERRLHVLPSQLWRRLCERRLNDLKRARKARLCA